MPQSNPKSQLKVVDFIRQVRRQLIVSCQALPGEPLFGADVMAKMALAAEQGGAKAIRANGPADIPAIHAETGCLVLADIATRVILEASGHESLQPLAPAYKAGADIPAITEAATWLGWGLASLAHILGPEVIVIGGSVGLLGDRYMQTVQEVKN